MCLWIQGRGHFQPLCLVFDTKVFLYEMATFGDIIFRKIIFFLNIMELMGSKCHYKKRRPSVMACTQFAVHYINWFPFKFRFWIKATMCLSSQNDPIMQMILQSLLWALYIETSSCASQKKLAAQPRRRLLKLLSWTFSCSAHFCCAFFKFYCFLFLLFSLVSVVFSISTGFYSTSIIVFQYFHCVFLTFVLFFLLALGLIQPLLVLFNLFSFLLFSLCFFNSSSLAFFLFMLFF